jgi:hypothetical protein
MRADRPAIEILRKLVATEADPFDRHFQCSLLEHRLYRCRTLYDSALDEYDATRVAHDADMATMRAVFMSKWGKVPRLDLYRQMAIRQSKAHDWNAALWWSERGLAVYGEDAAREAAVEDLTKRRIHALANQSARAAPESQRISQALLVCVADAARTRRTQSE